MSHHNLRSSGGQRVFCHECRETWSLQPQGLQCPRCQSEIVEMIEPDADNDPRDFDEAPSTPANPFQPQYPWSAVPDPDEDDIGSIGFGMTRGPFGSDFYSSRNNPPQPLNFSARPSPNQFITNGNPVFPDFASMLAGLGSPRGRGAFQQNFGPGWGPGVPIRPQSGSFSRDPRATRSWNGPRIEIHTTSGPGFSMTTATRSYGGGEMSGHEINALVDSLFPPSMSNTRGYPGGNARGRDRELPATSPISQLLNHVLNMGATGQHGDTVFTQEAFDRVMSQLMDQGPGSAPGPATEEAIRALPLKVVTKDMLDENTGKAECSICMDEVEVDEQVAELPCHHWFHFPCVEAWLKEHDTCPVCRAGITPKEGPRETVRTPAQEPLHDHDPFLLARQESASRNASQLSPTARRTSTRGSRRPSSSDHQHSDSQGRQHKRHNSTNMGRPELHTAPSTAFMLPSPNPSSRDYHSSSTSRSDRYLHRPSGPSSGSQYSDTRSPSSSSAPAPGFFERARNFLSGVASGSTNPTGANGSSSGAGGSGTNPTNHHNRHGHSSSRR